MKIQLELTLREAELLANVLVKEIESSNEDREQIEVCEKVYNILDDHITRY